MSGIIVDIKNRQHDFIDQHGNKVGPPQRVSGRLQAQGTPGQVPDNEGSETDPTGKEAQA